MYIEVIKIKTIFVLVVHLELVYLYQGSSDEITDILTNADMTLFELCLYKPVLMGAGRIIPRGTHQKTKQYFVFYT